MPDYQRTGRTLRRNHSNALPRYIIAYDTETLPVDVNGRAGNKSHRFRLGFAITCRMDGTTAVSVKERRILTTQHFWNLLREITRPNYTTWVVSHNVLFDMVVSGMTEMFERGELTVEWPRSKRTREDNEDGNVHCKSLCVIDSPPTIIACKLSSTQGRVVFVDSLNWFPTALAKLGDAAGLRKLSMPAFTEGNDRWLDYCKRDTEIVYRTFTELVKWVKDNDFGMFRYTAASQAMSAFRHRFMTHDIMFHDNAEVKQLERRSYFGGRTEVFRIGEVNETVHQVDINSLFPSVMDGGYYPSKLVCYDLCGGFYPVDSRRNWHEMVAEVLVETEHPLVPCNSEKGIIYPLGTFKTVLCGVELSYAVRMGWVKSVGSWAQYELKPIFTNWVQTLWKMRQEYKASGNELYEQFVKRLMNSLYGKFGQKSPAWVNTNGVYSALPWSRWTEKNYASGTVTEFRSFGWQVQQAVERGEMENTFVAISAFVTAAARMRMNYLRMVSGDRTVYYQGVDSLVVTSPGLERLKAAGEVEPTQLGKLRLQLSTNTGEIVGHSDYRLGDKLVISGRALDHEVKGNGQILQRRFSALSDLFTGHATSEVTETIAPWSRQTDYSKGTIGNDGWIYPLVRTTSVPESINGDNPAVATISAKAVTCAE